MRPSFRLLFSYSILHFSDVLYQYSIHRILAKMNDLNKSFFDANNYPENLSPNEASFHNVTNYHLRLLADEERLFARGSETHVDFLELEDAAGGKKNFSCALVIIY
jgi:hypothetical protein